MATVTICSDFGAQENKICHCFHFFPIYLPWSNGNRCHDLCFWMLSFKPAFSLSSFTFIKRLFSSSLLSAIREISSAYLKLLIFLPTVLIPACASSSLAFCMMYSSLAGYSPLQRIGHSWGTNTHTHTLTLHRVYIIMRQYTALMYSFTSFEPVHFSMSSSNCCFLTCIHFSQETGKVVWQSHLLKNFPPFVVIQTGLA